MVKNSLIYVISKNRNLIFKPNLCKKEKGNTKNFNLKTMKNLYHKYFFEIFWKIFFALNRFLGWFKAKKIFKKKILNFLIKKNLNFFFKLKFFSFPFSFLQRLGLNIKWWTLVRILVYHLIQFSSFLYLFQRF